jgi:hypothetical protein
MCSAVGLDERKEKTTGTFGGITYPAASVSSPGPAGLLVTIGCAVDQKLIYSAHVLLHYCALAIVIMRRTSYQIIMTMTTIYRGSYRGVLISVVPVRRSSPRGGAGPGGSFERLRHIQNVPNAVAKLVTLLRRRSAPLSPLSARRNGRWRILKSPKVSSAPYSASHLTVNFLYQSVHSAHDGMGDGALQIQVPTCCRPSSTPHHEGQGEILVPPHTR